VAFTDTGRVVGARAKRQTSSNPAGTVYDVKRVLGRVFDDSVVQDESKRLTYPVINGGRNRTMVEVMWRGEKKRFAPEELSAMVLVEMRDILRLTIAAIATAAGAPTDLASVAPHLARLVERAEREPAVVAEELAAFSTATIMQPLVPLMGLYRDQPARKVSNVSLPVVVAHGMGDSCFNAGMKSVTTAAGDHLGVYSTCIPTGDGRLRDTIDGFLMNMDKSVDVFAQKVKADPKLAGGFNAFGLSQGNNLIRGYIQKYNDPPVHTFMSICGINAGVAAFPQCSPTMPVVGGVCAALAEALGDLAYLEIIQEHLFQANYYRSPTHLNASQYLENSQLGQWNGEGVRNMTSDKVNWAKTSQFVWVRGTLDTVVWPNEGEQWGQLAAGYPQNKTIVPMEQAAWYTADAFGLKTADSAGKNAFEEFRGEHIRFTTAELNGWLDKYFV